MNYDIRARAEALAARPYLVYVEGDFSNPDEPLFVAYHPEAPRCVAQGTTEGEAKALLPEVFVEYIEHLLTHGLPVPEVAPPSAFTAQGGAPPVVVSTVLVTTVGGERTERPLDVVVTARE